MMPRVRANPHEGYEWCNLTSELLKRDTPETPDYLQLKQHPYHYVFVYGTLKSGGPRAEFLEGVPTLGEAYTVTKGWLMKSIRGQFPAITPAPLGAEGSAGRVFGEVYVVPPELFLELDKIEGNGTAYERQLLWVWLADQTFPTKNGHGRPSAKCWAYVGIPKWLGQQSTIYMVRKEDPKGQKVPYGEKYFEWDNPAPKTQLANMQEIWSRQYPDLANDRLPF